MQNGYLLVANNKAFLREFGKRAPKGLKTTWEDVPKEHLPVTLIDNGDFSSAAVNHSQREFEVFTALNPGDTRPKTIYFVPIEVLLLATPGLDELLKK
ncbi:hypothetical protein HON36_05550 [Candidatus Parcubacteria bacterium]|jgi:hypothetical protein|nr:hypothetical protein [Candidatus Parcubacteria bacterium]MBT7227935.1 hypothetical protein [Candidatus Parcubacteria bacterium]